MKTSLTSINWVSAPLWGTWWIGPRTREKMTITPVRKECMSCCFLVKSQKQKTLGSTAVMCCFLMCDSYLQTRWRKITNRPSLEYRKSISLPLKNMSGNYIAQWCLQERDNRIQAIQYENVGLQGEIRAKDQQIATLQRRYVGYLLNEDKNNGISIIAKNNEEAEYRYISICGQHGYRL